MSCLDCRWLVVAWVAGAIAWLYVMLVVGHVMVAYDTRTGSALCDDCIKKRPDVVEAIDRS